MYCLELAGEDDAFAAAEADAAAADGLTRVAPGLAVADDVALDRVAVLAYTRHADVLLARTDASVEAAVAALGDADLSRAGSVAVRARDVRTTTGVDTQRAERALGSVLVERGFSVDLEDPDHELRALFSDDTCLLGWHAAASIRDYGERRPTDRPFFQPGSMDPLLARALCNLAGADGHTTLLDPMCGTGGVLIEAGLVGARVVGNDAQEKMAHGAAENLAHFLEDYDVLHGDATRLGLDADAVDCVVFDAPYERQSKVATHALGDLVAGALAEANRVATGRCVLVADRDWRDEAREAGWQVEARFVRRVHRSLDRHILVLE
ncbi:methyltransferase domain-containing protein [Halarchaeum sp. P4]|uniref:methyltransferase domain-containing protein n=1 Tax=Halarchaeum sp. P4 TaxID=3421639 RepID=UPI003EBC2CD2